MFHPKVRMLLLCALLWASAAPAQELARVRAAKDADTRGYAPAAFAFDAAMETEPNDGPGAATPLDVGVPADGSVPDVADEDWYVVDATPGTWLTLSTSPTAAEHTDTVLEVFDGDGVTRLALDDDSGMDLYSAVLHFAVPAGGQFYLKVTRFSSTGDATYSVLAEDGTAPPPVPENDLVQDAFTLDPCNTAVTGTTTGANGEVSVLSCASDDPAFVDPLGGDVFYRIVVPWSYRLSVLVEPAGNWDLSAYLFTTPSNPTERCVAAADDAYAGEPETLEYDNAHPSGLPQEVWIGVDSWNAAAAGDFFLSTRCDFVVPARSTSFGTLKSRYPDR